MKNLKMGYRKHIKKSLKMLIQIPVMQSTNELLIPT